MGQKRMVYYCFGYLDLASFNIWELIVLKIKVLTSLQVLTVLDATPKDLARCCLYNSVFISYQTLSALTNYIFPSHGTLRMHIFRQIMNQIIACSTILFFLALMMTLCEPDNVLPIRYIQEKMR